MIVEGRKKNQEILIPLDETGDRVTEKRRSFELLSEFVHLKESASALTIDLDEQAWHLARLFGSIAELKDRSTDCRCPSVAEISESLQAFVEKNTTLTASNLAVVERHIDALHGALVEAGIATDA